MDEKNIILENTSEKEKEEGKTFFEKIKAFLKEKNFWSKLIVTIPAIYAAIYFMQNIFYKSTCENLYGIPAEYFKYNSDHNILVILAVAVVIGMFAYVYVQEKASKVLKLDYIGDWLYKLATGLITGMVCLSLCCEIVKKYVEKDNLVIDIIIMILMFLVFICGTASVFVVFSKKHRYPWVSAGIIAVTLLSATFGIVHEFIPFDGEKNKYEFVEIEDDEYVILSKTDDKILVAPFEIDEFQRCHIITSHYTFKDKYEGKYYYVNLKMSPIIEK